MNMQNTQLIGRKYTKAITRHDAHYKKLSQNCECIEPNSCLLNFKMDISNEWHIFLITATLYPHAKISLQDSMEKGNFKGIIMYISAIPSKAIEIQGEIIGAEITWMHGQLQYKGELNRDATRIINGTMWATTPNELNYSKCIG